MLQDPGGDDGSGRAGSWLKNTIGEGGSKAREGRDFDRMNRLDRIGGGEISPQRARRNLRDECWGNTASDTVLKVGSLFIFLCVPPWLIFKSGCLNINILS